MREHGADCAYAAHRNACTHARARGRVRWRLPVQLILTLFLTARDSVQLARPPTDVACVCTRARERARVLQCFWRPWLRSTAFLIRELHARHSGCLGRPRGPDCLAPPGD